MSHAFLEGSSITIFLIQLAFVIFFLGSLRALAGHMNDPFGNDAVDIPVTTLTARFCQDADLLVRNARAAGDSRSSNERPVAEAVVESRFRNERHVSHI